MFLNWLSGALDGVGRADFIGCVMQLPITSWDIDRRIGMCEVVLNVYVEI